MNNPFTLLQKHNFVKLLKLFSGVRGEVTCFIAKPRAEVRIRKRSRVKRTRVRKPGIFIGSAVGLNIKPRVILVFVRIVPIGRPAFVKRFGYYFKLTAGYFVRPEAFPSEHAVFGYVVT